MKLFSPYRHSGQASVASASRNPVWFSFHKKIIWIPDQFSFAAKATKRKFSGMTMVFVAGLVLTACSFGAPDLPSRYNIMPGKSITVSGDQTVYAVARENNVSMRELIVLNNLQPPFSLRPGQTLVLPAGGGAGFSSYDTAPVPVAAPSPAIEQAALPPVQSVQSAPLPPPAASNDKKPVGVLLPPVQSAPVESLNKPTPPPQSVATTVTQPPAPVAAAPEAKPAQPQAVAPSSISMVWPVQGPVLSKFGPKGQGLNNDGVNIGAPKGAPVVAAANGTVVYAGNEMKGFGNLILIRHEGGWVTAYAHLGRMLVNKDAVVAQGDMIGTVGKTGDVPSPQLHFETRYDGKPVDPAGVVKKQ